MSQVSRLRRRDELSPSQRRYMRRTRRDDPLTLWVGGIGSFLLVVGLFGILAPRPILRFMAQLGFFDTEAAYSDELGRKIGVAVDVLSVVRAFPYFFLAGIVLIIVAAFLHVLSRRSFEKSS